MTPKADAPKPTKAEHTHQGKVIPMILLSVSSEDDEPWRHSLLLGCPKCPKTAVLRPKVTKKRPVDEAFRAFYEAVPDPYGYRQGYLGGKR